MNAVRKWLLTGLLVIVPGVITVWVLHWIVSTLDQTLAILPEAWHPDRLLGMHIPGFGVLLTLAILLSVGAVASNFVGRKLVSWGDAVISRIPVVRSIYSSVKQVSDTVFSDSGNAFRTAVLVQWPREGVWTVLLSPAAPPSKWPAICGMITSASFCPHHPQPNGGLFRAHAQKRLRGAGDERGCRAQIHRVHGGGGTACTRPGRSETLIFCNRIPEMQEETPWPCAPNTAVLSPKP